MTLTIELLPKNPPTCPVHHTTMRWEGYGWICILCARENALHDELDRLEREVRQTHESVRPGLW